MINRFSRRATAALVWAAPVLCSACSSRAGGNVTTPCEYGDWTPLRAVPSIPVPTNPRVATSAQGTYIAGTDVRYHGPNRLSDRSLAVITLDGRDLVKPPGAFHFVNPALLADARGRLHLLWGEFPADAPPRTESDWIPFPKISAVWTATYDPTSRDPRWSTPRPLLEEPGIQWYHARTEDNDGRLGGGTVTTMVSSMGRPASLVSFRFDNDSLVSARIDSVGAPAYSSVASVGDTVYLALVDAAESPQADDNSVWLTRSFDRGRKWERKSLVSLSGSEPAYQVRVHVTPNHHVHLLWLQTHAGALATIRHVESADNGRTWSPPDDLYPSASPAADKMPLANLLSVVDRCGTIHVVHEYKDKVMRIEYAKWDRTWSAVTPLAPNVDVIGTVVHRGPDERLRLVTVTIAAPLGLASPTRQTLQFTERIPEAVR